MANEDTHNEVTAEDISKASALLSGKGEATDDSAEKAIPPQFEKKDDEGSKEKEKDAEKSVPASEVADIVEKAVTKAVEMVKAELFAHQTEVTKGIAAIDQKVTDVQTSTKAVLQFQGASVEVLKGFQAVTKGIEVKVDEIGNQPAPRKGAVAVIEKSAPVATASKALDTNPLWDWMRAENFDLNTKFDTQARVLGGNYADIPQTVLKSMGVEQ